MTVHPDEVGRARRGDPAGVLKGEVKDVLLLDVTPLSLGVETRAGVMTKIVDRNTTIRCAARRLLHGAGTTSPRWTCRAAGRRERASDNRVLRRFR